MQIWFIVLLLIIPALVYWHKSEFPRHDTLMSRVDGREIRRKLKADKKISHMPIIMIPATRDVINSTRDAGAYDFIAKAFEMSELLNKVKKYIDR